MKIKRSEVNFFKRYPEKYIEIMKQVASLETTDKGSEEMDLRRKLVRGTLLESEIEED